MGYLTLIEVKTRFAAWRKMKHHREPIPNELWDAAISLTEKHSICKVSKALSLCYTTLKKRAAAAQIKQSAPPLHTTQDFILRERPSSTFSPSQNHSGTKSDDPGNAAYAYYAGR